MLITTGTLVVGKYRLETELARGGMGSVWLARHVALDSHVAVKFLAPKLTDSKNYLGRFEREARAAARIDSPYVVHVQDFGVEAGTPYLVMELLHGEDLGTRLDRELRLDLAEAAQILIQAGRGIRRAHEAGIVHRDLKPSNVFLAIIDDEEVVKLLDFGIAKDTGSSVGECTQRGLILGSPHYMSPEQAMGEGVDHRSDLWSVGVVLYRMVTGVLPFPGNGMPQVLSKVLGKQPPKMAEVAPDLPAQLDGFFASALAKGKDQRFQNIHELMESFLAIAAPELDAERPSSHGLRCAITSPRRAAVVVSSEAAITLDAPVTSNAPVISDAHGAEEQPTLPSQNDARALASTRVERLREAPKPAAPATLPEPTSVTKRSMKDPMQAPRSRWQPRWSFAAGVVATLIATGLITILLGSGPPPPSASGTAAAPLRGDPSSGPLNVSPPPAGPPPALPGTLPSPFSTADAGAAASSPARNSF
jgi:serine/threonine protein kinase